MDETPGKSNGVHYSSECVSAVQVDSLKERKQKSNDVFPSTKAGRYSKFPDESIRQEYRDIRVDTRYKNTYCVSHLVKKLVHDNTH